MLASLTKTSGNHSGSIQLSTAPLLARMDCRFAQHLAGVTNTQHNLPQQLALTDGHANKKSSVPVNIPALREAIPPLGKRQQLLEIAANAALASLPYTLDLGLEAVINLGGDKTILSKWKLAKDVDLMTNLGNFANTIGMKYEPQHARLIDRHTGLAVYMLSNSANKEVRLIFGHTTSGAYTSSMHLIPSIARTIANIPITNRQWLANFQNALFDKTPQSYQQAKHLVGELLELMQQPNNLNGYTLSLSGHSKGGGEAAYAAAMNGGLKAYCFGSAEWGQGPVQDIVKHYINQPDALEKALDKINHYRIEGDPIPVLSKKIPLKALYLVGSMMTFPLKKGANPLFLYRVPGIGPHIGFSYFINEYIRSLR